MRRRITIAVLALGAIVGYGSGIAHILHAHHAGCSDYHHGRARMSG
jgi:hypothetical protein